MSHGSIGLLSMGSRAIGLTEVTGLTATMQVESKAHISEMYSSGKHMSSAGAETHGRTCIRRHRQ